jgi:hypothetical protein
VHYRADEIARQIHLIYEVGRNEEIAGSALNLFESMKNRGVPVTLLPQ